MRQSRDVDFSRTLVFGNGGSGKTWLARRLAQQLTLPLIHLDELHWEPGRIGIARDKALVAQMVEQEAQAESWIIEGVYGWLAKIAAPRASMLVWLDLGEEECIANIRARGQQYGGTQTQFDELIAWVADYRVRTNANSFRAHSELFEGFAGRKVRLTSRAAISDFADAAGIAV